MPVVVALTIFTAASTSLLAMLFSFGNVWDLNKLLDQRGWIAPLVAPVVDLSVVGLIVALQWLSIAGATNDELRSPKRWLVQAGVLTMLLNSSPAFIMFTTGAIDGHADGKLLGLGIVDAITPWFLIGWSHIGPLLLRLFLTVKARQRAEAAAYEAQRAAARAEHAAAEHAARVRAAELVQAEQVFAEAAELRAAADRARERLTHDQERLAADRAALAGDRDRTWADLARERDAIAAERATLEHAAARAERATAAFDQARTTPVQPATAPPGPVRTTPTRAGAHHPLPRPLSEIITRRAPGGAPTAPGGADTMHQGGAVSAPGGAPQGGADDSDGGAVPIARGEDGYRAVLVAVRAATHGQATGWDDLRAQLADEGNVAVSLRKIEKSIAGVSRRRIATALEHTHLLDWDAQDSRDNAPQEVTA